MPICNKCSIEKPIEDFPAYTDKITAFSGKTYKKHCKECNKLAAREWRKANPNKRGNGKISNIPLEERKWMSAVRTRLNQAKSRCKKRGLPEPILTDIELYSLLIKQCKKCALTGVDLCIERNNPLCLSLDQITPSKGYTLDNVQWTAWCVNFAKADLTMQDFVDMCQAVTAHMRK